MNAGLYARVSTHDQQTLPLQLHAMRAYVKKRRWTLVMQVQEIGSGAVPRPKREALLKAAHRRELDVIVVWRLDRWGQSLADLVVTLKALHELGVGFVSLTEALDLTTPSGRAMAGMLAVFAEFEREIIREPVKAGLAQARAAGRILGRPRSTAKQAPAVKALFAKGFSRSEIARRVGIGRTSVRRLLMYVTPWCPILTRISAVPEYELRPRADACEWSSLEEKEASQEKTRNFVR